MACVGKFFFVSLLLLPIACTSGITEGGRATAMQSLCDTPVHGQHFSACGRLTAAGLDLPLNGPAVVGAFDTSLAPPGSGHGLTVKQGGFREIN